MPSKLSYWNRGFTWIFIVLILFLMFLAVFQTLTSRQLQEAAYEVAITDIPAISANDEIRQAVATGYIFILNCLVAEEEERQNLNIQGLFEMMKGVDENLEILEILVEEERGKILLREIRLLKTIYRKGALELIDRCREGEEITFEELIGFNLIFNDYRSKLLEFSLFNVSKTIEDTLILEKQISRESVINNIFILFTLIVSIILAYFIYTTSKKEKNFSEQLLLEIEERKQSERRLLEYSGELKAANETKARLISVLSHDLRSPLNSMTGSTELLQSNAENMTIEEIKQFAQVINNSSKKLLDQLNNILDWITTQSVNEGLIQKNINPRIAANKVLELLQEVATSKEIKIYNQINPSHEVLADENHLYSIINNLINNAIKFTPRGGSVYLSSDEQPENILLKIWDTGVGMDKETVERLFSKRVISTQGTEKEKGTGVGLRLVKEFTEQMGGEISVESQPGEGTTFYIKLPKLKS